MDTKVLPINIIRCPRLERFAIIDYKRASFVRVDCKTRLCEHSVGMLLGRYSGQGMKREEDVRWIWLVQR